MKKALKNIGLSESEIKVYLAILKMGGGYVSRIAQNSGVERTNCYHTLSNLVNKGYVSITNQGNFKYYLPESPEKILTQHRNKLKMIEKVVPELLSLQNMGQIQAPQMKYFEGLEGIKTVMNKCLDCETEVLSYTNLEKLKVKFPDMLKQYCEDKDSKRVRTRIISPYHPDVETFLADYFSEEYRKKFIQLIFINPEEFYLENDITIFDDKVSMISLNPDENIGVVIESKVYAETSRTIFNLSWLGATSFVAR